MRSRLAGPALVVIVLAGLLFGMFGMTVGANEATRAMLDAGYQDVGAVEHAWVVCEEWHLCGRVEAENPRGRRVQVIVSCGVWGQGCSIRH